MAGSLGPEDFYLIDQWPGVATTRQGEPKNGFDSTYAGNDATDWLPYYPPGTKIAFYHDHTVGGGGSSVACRGWTTMMYARYYSYEIASGTDVSGPSIVGAACSSAKARGEIAFTRDLSGGNEASCSVPAGILCHSVGNGNYAWLWVGGVCPHGDVTKLDVTGFITDGTVDAGKFFYVGGGTDSSLATFVGTVADSTMALLPIGFAWVDNT